MGRALRPSTPGDFPVAGKVTKGAPRAMPFGIPRCVVAALFALAALRSVSRRATFYYKPRPICHFKLVGKSVFFLPKLHRGSHPLLSIRGSAGMPSRMPQVLYSRNQYRYGRRRGNPRGSAPLCRRSRNQEVPGVSCAGGPGTRRFLAYLCLLSLREKVGRGAGRSARSLRVWELCSHIGECRGGPQAAPRIGVAGAYFPCASIRSARSLR